MPDDGFVRQNQVVADDACRSIQRRNFVFRDFLVRRVQERIGDKHAIFGQLVQIESDFVFCEIVYAVAAENQAVFAVVHDLLVGLQIHSPAVACTDVGVVREISVSLNVAADFQGRERQVLGSVDFGLDFRRRVEILVREGVPVERPVDGPDGQGFEISMIVLVNHGIRDVSVHVLPDVGFDGPDLVVRSGEHIGEGVAVLGDIFRDFVPVQDDAVRVVLQYLGQGGRVERRFSGRVDNSVLKIDVMDNDRSAVVAACRSHESALRAVQRDGDRSVMFKRILKQLDEADCSPYVERAPEAFIGRPGLGLVILQPDGSFDKSDMLLEAARDNAAVLGERQLFLFGRTGVIGKDDVRFGLVQGRFGGCDKFVLRSVEELVADKAAPGVELLDDINRPGRDFELDIEFFAGLVQVAGEFAFKLRRRHEIRHGRSHDEGVVLLGVELEPAVILVHVLDTDDVDIPVRDVLGNLRVFPCDNGHVVAVVRQAPGGLECQAAAEPVGNKFNAVDLCGDGPAGDDDVDSFQQIHSLHFFLLVIGHTGPWSGRTCPGTAPIRA